MATTNPLPPPTQDQLRQAQYNRLASYTSLGALILCPILIALPPRKFDLYTIALISGTAIGGNQVLREYSGRSITERVPTLRRLGLHGTGESVGKNREERSAGWEREREGLPSGTDGHKSRPGPTTTALARAVKAAEDAQAQSFRDLAVEQEAQMLRKVDWKAQRDAREKKALEEGRGYGGLIIDQIWEVWNWGRERPGEIEEKVVKGEDGERK